MTNKKTFWWSIVGLMLVGLLVYAPLSQSYGFYYNDWHPVLGQITNTSLKILFDVDRPVLGEIYNITAVIFGNNPFLWQIFAISLRILGALGFFTILIQLWPKQKRAVFLMALFFLIYPGFMQQPIALTFSNHFLGLAIGFVSISLTILSINSRKIFNRLIIIIFVLAALGLESIYLMIYEYMVGIELVRWALVWLVVNRRQSISIWEKTKRWIKNSWAYFLPILGLFYYRFFYFVSTRPTMNVDSLLTSYQSNYFELIQQLSVGLFQAIVNTSIFVYAVPLYKRLEGITFYPLIGGLLLALLVFGIVFLVQRKIDDDPVEVNENDHNWAKQCLILGSLFVFFTLVPIIVTGRSVEYANLLDRYTLQSSFGAAMMVVGFSYWLLNQKLQPIFFGLLIILSTLFHFTNGMYWKNHWDFQRDLFWQISWRVPQLKPDTVVLVLQPEGYLFREDEDVYAPLNLIYYPDKGFIHIAAEVLANNTIDDLIHQNTTYRSYRTIGFKKDFSQALIISNTNPKTCVHVIDGEHPELIQNEEPLIKLAAPYSKIQQIMTDRQAPAPPKNPFGVEPEHTWCYIYQKAELARQDKKWEEIVFLAMEAERNNFMANDLSEWNPFLEGYAAVGNWEKAEQYLNLFSEDEGFRKNYCSTHQHYANTEDFRYQIYDELCIQAELKNGE